MAQRFGMFLQRLLRDRGLNAPELARRMGRTERTVYYWLRETRVPKDAVPLLANALQVPPAELRAALDLAMPRSRKSRASSTNYDAISPDRYDSIPAFESVAAGPLGMADVLQLTGPPASQDRFKVRVRGQSMMPDYPDGCWVVFSRPQALAEGLVDERDYLVWTTGQESTFKRLVRDPADPWQFLLLRPLNPDRRQFPETRLHRAEIAYLARAVRKEIELP